MKKTILFIALAMFAGCVFAQNDSDEKTFKFGIGTTFSLPAGDLKNASSYGIGFELTGIYNFAENIDFFAQAGADFFNSSTPYGTSLLQIPVIAGVHYKINGFFAGAGVGYGHWISSNSESPSTGGFLYSPQIGYNFGKLQILLNYTSTIVTGGSLSYAGLKLFRTF